MKYNEDLILKELKLKPSGGKGWHIGDCMYCGKADHFGVNFRITRKNPMPSFNCFKCHKSGSVYELLKFLGRLDLVSGVPDVDLSAALKKLRVESNIRNTITDLPFVDKPIGFRRIHSHEYLNGRGMEPFQYDMLGIGLADLDPRYNSDYVLFSVVEDGKFMGALGRCLDDKAVSDKILPKYKNTRSDFGKLLMGIDEIVQGVTKRVIAVEGVMDKANVDRKMYLHTVSEAKCLCTFGKKISEDQIAKLIHRGVEDLDLMYDPEDAFGDMKKLAESCSKYIRIRLLRGISGCDPGDASQYELMEVIGNPVNIVDFSLTTLGKKIKK